MWLRDQRAVHPRDPVDDRGQPEPDEQRKADQVGEVPVADVHRGDPQRHRDREQQERHERDGIEPDHTEREPVSDGEEGEEHQRLEREVDERDADGRQGKDLAGERHLLDEVRVRDHRDRARCEGNREEVPCQQTSEEELRIVLRRRPEHLRHEREDREEHHRVEERPDGAEHGAGVLDLELLANEVEQHLPVVPQLADTLPQPQVRRLGRSFGGSGYGGDRSSSERLHGRTRRSARV